MIHSFITSQLNYCDSLYVGLDQLSIQRLQLVKNAAARLLIGKNTRGHIFPLLLSLYWLPVRYRIEFKILLFALRAVNGLAPLYLHELLHVHAPAGALRSTNQLFLDVPKTRLRTRGDRALAVAAPNLWNSLPLQIRSAPFLNILNRC